MSQCFLDIGLTELTSDIAKWCPTKADCTKANFDKCIRDYLEAVAGFPNVGNQLICWLCTAKKPALMPMHEFMRHWVQLLSYLDNGYIHQTMELPMAQKKSKQIFFVQTKADQFKFTETIKMVTKDPTRLIAFFEQCLSAAKAAGVLEKITMTRSSEKRRRWLIFLSCAAMNWATGSIVTRSGTIIKEPTGSRQPMTRLSSLRQ
jgi:hypothetical protein